MITISTRTPDQSGPGRRGAGRRTARRWGWLYGLAAALAVVLTAGCANPECRPEADEPNESVSCAAEQHEVSVKAENDGLERKTKYVAARPEEPVAITAQDLGIAAEDLNGYGRKDLDPGPSMARFPTGISVVEVAAMQGEGNRRYLRVVKSRTGSVVAWMHLWDDLPSVREVSHLRTLYQDPRGTNPRVLLDVSRRNACELCVIYAQQADAESDATYVAVLWDAGQERPLSVFRIPVQLPEKVRAELEKSKGLGRWRDEATYRAEADLRLAVAEAMWDIVARDQKSATTQPNPWMDYNYLPNFPRDYDHWKRSLRRGAAERREELAPVETEENEP